MGRKVFSFVNKFEVCLFFHESKSSQKALGPFFTLKNQKYCEVVNFSINFTKFKKLYQKFIRTSIRFLGYDFKLKGGDILKGRYRELLPPSVT